MFSYLAEQLEPNTCNWLKFPSTSNLRLATVRNKQHCFNDTGSQRFGNRLTFCKHTESLINKPLSHLPTITQTVKIIIPRGFSI